tara:strand:- start:1325 stop:1564 length:240 start_codon:yes stop_codon:yes gene_type:complete
MDKINDFDKYIVIWSDEEGSRIYDPFRNYEDAYQYMVEKLSQGCWAHLGLNEKLPKIHYSKVKPVVNRSLGRTTKTKKD